MIILHGGIEHFFLAPFNADIKSIAFSLSNINRFTGHVGIYSVAQHSVLVAQQLPDNLKLSGLLHDAPEAYIGDVSSPLKRLLPDYKHIEDFYHKEIDRQFGTDTRCNEVKSADLRMLVTEAKHFGLPLDRFPNMQTFNIDIERWSPEFAMNAFLKMYAELTGTVYTMFDSDGRRSIFCDVDE